MLTIPTNVVFHSDTKTLLAIDTCIDMSLAGIGVNILLTGPQGSGKSTLARAIAARYARCFAEIEVGLISEAAELFGSLTLVDGNTVFQESLFSKAIQIPNCIVHLQEINRGESDRVLNGIFSVLDPDQRAIYHPESSRLLKVAEGVIFVASMNEGAQYIGTLPFDAALRDRFTVRIELDYPDTSTEAGIIKDKSGCSFTDAQILARAAARLRGNKDYKGLPVSTRSLIAAGQMVSRGIPIAEAWCNTTTLSSEDNQVALAFFQAQGIPLPQAPEPVVITDS